MNNKNNGHNPGYLDGQNKLLGDALNSVKVNSHRMRSFLVSVFIYFNWRLILHNINS